MYLDFWGSTVHILCGTAYRFVTPNSNSIAQTGTEVNKVKHTASPHMQITFCIWGLVSYKKSCNESRCRGCQSHHDQGQVPVRQ